MFKALMLAGALMCAPVAAAAHEGGPTDPQIAHVAYTAGLLDVTAAEQALEKSTNPAVRAFAEEMVRDHKAVNDAAVALVTRLNVTPEANPISAGLSEQAAATHARLALLEGAEFDRAYVANEVAYHQAVNDALGAALIPGAHNPELKSLLETGLTLFREHQAHAEHLAMELR
jgi:putative membrane protein